MKNTKKLYELLKFEVLDVAEQEKNSGEYELSPSNPESFIVWKFQSEYSLREKQVGLGVAVKDWLQGLALPVEFMTYRVFKKYGEPLGYKDAHDFDEIYWDTLTQVVCDIITRERFTLRKLA